MAGEQNATAVWARKKGDMGGKEGGGIRRGGCARSREKKGTKNMVGQSLWPAAVADGHVGKNGWWEVELTGGPTLEVGERRGWWPGGLTGWAARVKWAGGEKRESGPGKWVSAQE